MNRESSFLSPHAITETNTERRTTLQDNSFLNATQSSPYFNNENNGAIRNRASFYSLTVCTVDEANSSNDHPPGNFTQSAIGHSLPQFHVPNFRLQELISKYLKHEIAINTSNIPSLKFAPSSTDLKSIVYNSAPVDVTIDNYVLRVITYAHCEDPVFIVALVYLNRLKQNQKELAICELNVHRLFITTVILATKYIQDYLFPMSYYARCGGVPTVSEMNRLEIAVLQFLQFDLFVSSAEYNRMFEYLKGFIARRNNYGSEPISDEPQDDNVSQVTFINSG